MTRETQTTDSENVPTPEIPPDIMDKAEKVYAEIFHHSFSHTCVPIIAQALLAERERLKLPPKADIEKFLDVVQTLSEFEAYERFNRGNGAFREEELPFPEVIRMRDWLMRICK